MKNIKIIIAVFIILIIRTHAQTSVYVKGTGQNYQANRVVKLNNQFIVNSGGRGLCLTVIDAITHQHVSSTIYDTYGNSTASDNLALALNDLQRGYIGILTSYDAWEANVTENLKTAARRLGLFKLGSGIESGYRRPYAAIFRGSGISLNNIEPNNIAYEVMQSHSSGAERAVIATWLIDDAFIGNNLANALISGDGSVSGPVLSIDGSNNIGIGTTSPNEKLSVNGKIHTKEVRVDLVGWSDFVFHDDYELPSLQEVENHIKEKGHLKDIPSAKEVEESGILLGEMNAKLLQKIEELTLYIIRQQELIESLEADNIDNKSLSQRISEIEKILISKK